MSNCQETVLIVQKNFQCRGILTYNAGIMPAAGVSNRELKRYLLAEKLSKVLESKKISKTRFKSHSHSKFRKPSETELEIQGHFLKNPEKDIYLRELIKELKLPKSTSCNVLKQLEKYGFINLSIREIYRGRPVRCYRVTDSGIKHFERCKFEHEFEEFEKSKESDSKKRKK